MRERESRLRSRHRRRVDWEEELRKTERIRRNGFFTSGLSFFVAVAAVAGMNWYKDGGIVVGRKVLATFCFFVAMFLVRGVFKRRERLRRAREEADATQDGE